MTLPEIVMISVTKLIVLYGKREMPWNDQAGKQRSKVSRMSQISSKDGWVNFRRTVWRWYAVRCISTTNILGLWLCDAVSSSSSENEFWDTPMAHNHNHTSNNNQLVHRYCSWWLLNMLVLDVIYDKIYDIFPNGILQSDNATFNVK